MIGCHRHRECERVQGLKRCHHQDRRSRGQGHRHRELQPGWHNRCHLHSDSRRLGSGSIHYHLSHCHLHRRQRLLLASEDHRRCREVGQPQRHVQERRCWCQHPGRRLLGFPWCRRRRWCSRTLSSVRAWHHLFTS